MNTSGEKPKDERSFSRSFSSEALLQQALAGLLTRMPDTTGVQILQGTQELGKDLVFYIRGGFDEQVLCACVVKNTRITGDAGKSEGARTVFNQAQQAFDSPHIDTNGREVRVERVYIVTPFDLTPSTIASIRGRLNERAGQVVFIGGSQLFDLFKQYWPDYLADEADAIAHHLRHTANRYEEDNPLSNIASQYHLGSVDTSSRKIYVPQVFHRDLRIYTMGVVLTKSIPSEKILSREWTFKDLSKVKGDLKRLKQALLLLEQWGYVDLQEAPAGATLEDEIIKFSVAVEAAWKVAARKELGISDKEFPNIPASEAVFLNNNPGLIKQQISLSRKLSVALSALKNALSKLKKFIDSQSKDNFLACDYELFHTVCMLDDFAQTAPDGILEAHESVRIKISKDIIDIWHSSLMIVGSPGYGKTSFCRWHALQDVENFSSEKSTVLPVYVPLHRLAQGELGSFEETFLPNLGKSALLAERSDLGKSSSKRIRLYLDGLDEISSPARREEVVNLASREIDKHEKYQMVLTARDYVHGIWLKWIPRIQLSGFDDTEIIGLVAKWLGKDSEEAKNFYNQLRVTPALTPLMRTPLLATLIILVFRQTGRLPESKTKLYDIFIDLLSGGWDMAKSINRGSKFGSTIKTLVLKTLAVRLHEKGRRDFGDADLEAVIRSIFSEKIINDWEVVRDEVVIDGIVGKSGDIYQFSHFSFQEYLAAKGFMGDPQPKRARRALESLLLGNDWWREVIRFYIGLSANPREITLWLLSEIDRVADKGEILQDRIVDVLTGVVESFPDFPVKDLIDYTATKNSLSRLEL